MGVLLMPCAITNRATAAKNAQMGDFNTKWWLRSDLNQRHKALQASALPTELQSHTPLYYHTTPLITNTFDYHIIYVIIMAVPVDGILFGREGSYERPKRYVSRKENIYLF